MQDGYQVEIEELDAQNRNEVELLYVLKRLRSGDFHASDLKDLQTIAVERYLQAVRKRNQLRRNWHPKQSLACDLSTLSFIKKANASAAITKRLKEAVIKYPDGIKAIPESCIEEIRQRLIDDIYVKKDGRRKAPLEIAVRKILRNSPDDTYKEVIEEMRNNPTNYGIVEINDEMVTFESKRGTDGKDVIRRSRNLSTVKNIVSKVRKENP